MKKSNQIQRALDRWTEKIYPSKKEFLEILKSGKKLSFYIGIDPTGPDMHLGHSTNYLLMRELQKAGHKIILLIGDFTARIGDPSGRENARKPLTSAQIKRNMKTYKEQAGKILDFEDPKNPVEIKFNSTWLSKLTPKDFIKLMARVTYQQLIERDTFQKRIKENKPIGFHELIYPLLQGYDSVALKIDAEIGGTDQTFNMLVGRDLVKTYLGKEKFVATTPLLENPKTGKKLMSKSEGTYIALNDTPYDMYGKTMALPDEAVLPVFKLCTEIPMEKVKEYEKGLADGTNPMAIKKVLAYEIVKMYHGEARALEAHVEFEKVFQKGKLPSEITEISLSVIRDSLSVIELLTKTGLVPSKSEAKRLVRQGAVEIDQLPVTSYQLPVKVREGMIIRVGKRKFAKIKLKGE